MLGKSEPNIEDKVIRNLLATAEPGTFLYNHLLRKLATGPESLQSRIAMGVSSLVSSILGSGSSQSSSTRDTLSSRKDSQEEGREEEGERDEKEGSDSEGYEDDDDIEGARGERRRRGVPMATDEPSGGSEPLKIKRKKQQKKKKRIERKETNLVDALAENWPCVMATILGFYPQEECYSHHAHGRHTLGGGESKEQHDTDTDTDTHSHSQSQSQSCSQSLPTPTKRHTSRRHDQQLPPPTLCHPKRIIIHAPLVRMHVRVRGSCLPFSC